MIDPCKHLKKRRLSGTVVPDETKPVAVVQLQGYPRQRRNRYVAVVQILLVYEATCRILEQCTPQAALHSVDRKIQVDVFDENCRHFYTQNAILFRKLENALNVTVQPTRVTAAIMM